MKDQAIVLSYNPEGNLMNEKLVFNPYQRIIHLNYPIHLLRTKDISSAKGIFCYNVYRQENGTVQYMEMSSFTANLLQQLIQHSSSHSVNELLNSLLNQVAEDNKLSIANEVHKFCYLLREKGLILGTI